MNGADLKFEPCAECGGVTFNFRNQRTIFYLSDVIKLRCNNCGDVVTIEKQPQPAEAVHQRQ
jgi:hypothetical protein